MEKIEKIIVVRGGSVPELSKYDLNRYIQEIYNQFMKDGAIHWRDKDITTKEEFMNTLIDFNDDRHAHGYTTMTDEELKELNDKMIEPRIVVPTKELVALENEIEKIYNDMYNQLCTLKLQLEQFKRATIVTTGATKPTTKKKGVK